MSSGLVRAAVPALGMQPCHTSSAASPEQGMTLSCTMTNALSSVQAQRREPPSVSGAGVLLSEESGNTDPKACRNIPKHKDPCDMGGIVFLSVTLDSRAITARPADAALRISPPVKEVPLAPLTGTDSQDSRSAV